MAMEDGLNFNFWANEIKPNGTTTVKLANGDDALHLTMACFGEEVKENSRTVLVCNCNGRSGPIAVLSQGLNENQHLDLMISGNTVCEFSLKGANPSSVFLSGFIQPLVDAEDLGAAALENEETVNAKEAETEEPSLTAGGVKRQLSVPDRPKKKAKSEPAPVEETSQNVEESTDVQMADVEEAETPVESKPATPASQPKESTASPKKKKKKKSKFTYNEMGLGIRNIKEGSGEAVTEGDTVRVRYIGQLAGGKKSIFDKNLTDGFTFTVGEGTVIKGLSQGVLGMKKEGKRKIMIPSDLAYGKEGSGSEIPPSSDLLFTVELLEVV